MAFDPPMLAGDDASLLAQAAAGSAAAAAEIYRRYANTVYRFVWALTGSEADASDVLQETFIAVIERLSGFDPARGSCAAYLCGVARHLAYARHRTRVAVVDDIEALVDANSSYAEAPPLPDEVTEKRRAIARLHAAIRHLPPPFREVLILVELQELSYADAAAVAGIELGTVRSRLSRAKTRLAELLAREKTI